MSEQFEADNLENAFNTVHELHAEEVADARAEGERAGLERACAVMCEGCRKGWLIDPAKPIHMGPDWPKQPKQRMWCEAQPIRALIQDKEKVHD